MRIKQALAALLLVASACPAQKDYTPCYAPSVLNTVTPKWHIPNRTPVPYAQTREADIMWEKWIWRTIDLREKMNLQYYYPLEPSNNRISLLSVISCAIDAGKLIPYNPLSGDDFGVPMTREEALSIGNRTDTLQIPDLYDPSVLHDTVINTTLDPKSVLEYHLKEIWFFDRQRSVMDVRIIGICPVRYVVDPISGEFKGKQEMYWLYFPQLRNIIASVMAYNRFNDVGQLSYDDVFLKRMFASYTYKESNVYDRVITDYKTGMDAQLESERVKTDIMNFEQDLWDW